MAKSRSSAKKKPSKLHTKKDKAGKLPSFVNELFEYQRKRKKEKQIPLYGFSESVEHLVSHRIRECANSGLNVLVVGETGTGKELVVNEIKRLSNIPDSKFRAVNSAQFSKELLASELFGHMKGAFTGAMEDKEGIFDVLDGGALFLDELGAMPKDLQAQVLRVVEEQVYRPVGSTETKTLKKGLRVFAATNNANNIRQDLKWRFQEQIFIPPLRERLSDVFAILQGLLDDAKKDGQVRPETEWAIIPDTFVRMLYSLWPGNVRELKNAVHTSIARWRLAGRKSNYILFYYTPGKDAGEMLQNIHIVQLLWADLVKTIRSSSAQKQRTGLLKIPLGNKRIESMTGLFVVGLLGSFAVQNLTTDMHYYNNSIDVFPKYCLSCREAIYVLCFITRHRFHRYDDTLRDPKLSIHIDLSSGKVTSSVRTEETKFDMEELQLWLQLVDKVKGSFFDLPPVLSRRFNAETLSVWYI